MLNLQRLLEDFYSDEAVERQPLTEPQIKVVKQTIKNILNKFGSKNDPEKAAFQLADWDDEAEDASVDSIFHFRYFPESGEDGTVEHQAERFEFVISGGENGNGNWTDYLAQLQSIISNIKNKTGWEPVIVNVENDVCDDLFDAQVALYNPKPETGSHLKCLSGTKNVVEYEEVLATKFEEGYRQDLWDRLVHAIATDLSNSYKTYHLDNNKETKNSLEAVLSYLESNAGYDDVRFEKALNSRNAKGNHYNSMGKLIPNDRPWTALLQNVLYYIDRDLDEGLDEDIEKHDTLNPKLFEDNKLKPEVREKINEIVDTFIAELSEDDIEIEVEDIILVGSNVSYNYTKDSDLDIHIRANIENFHCPDNLYPLLYGAYKSIFNKNMSISFYGIPVELYVETDSTPLRSNGIYSVVKDDWIKEPVPADIPDIDYSEVLDKVQPYIDRFEAVKDTYDIKEVDDLITDIYDERQEGMSGEGEYDIHNLIFKEFRNQGCLDELKELRHDILSNQLSLESFSEALIESNGRNYLTSSEIYMYRQLLERAVRTQVIVFNNGRFTINNVKENDVDYLVRILNNMDEVIDAHKIAGRFDFNNVMKASRGMPDRY